MKPLFIRGQNFPDLNHEFHQWAQINLERNSEVRPGGQRANSTAISMLAESRQKGHAGRMPQSEMEIPRRRRSACADAALRAELERILRMTIEERVKAALSMQELFAWLNPTAKTQ